MKKYSLLFLKRRLRIVFVSSTFLFLIFFFALILCKNAVYSPLFALWSYALALVWYAADILLTIRFQTMIRYQERRFGIPFRDTNAAALFPHSNTFLSDDWLIFAGRSAFYRQYINDMQIITKRTGMGNDFYLRLQTDDNRTYTVTVDSDVNSKKIRQWFQRS